MDNLTDTLKEISERCEKATPGPRGYEMHFAKYREDTLKLLAIIEKLMEQRNELVTELEGTGNPQLDEIGNRAVIGLQDAELLAILKGGSDAR